MDNNVRISKASAGVYNGKQLKPGYMLLRATQAVTLTDAMRAKGMSADNLKVAKINKYDRPPVHVEHERERRRCGKVKDVFFNQDDGYQYAVAACDLNTKDQAAQRFYRKLERGEPVGVSVAFVQPDPAEIKSPDEYYSKLVEISFTENPLEKDAKVLRFVSHSETGEPLSLVPFQIYSHNMSAAKSSLGATPNTAAAAATSSSSSGVIPAQAATPAQAAAAAAASGDAEMADATAKRQKTNEADGDAMQQDAKVPETTKPARTFMTPQQALELAMASTANPAEGLQKLLTAYAELHSQHEDDSSELKNTKEMLDMATQGVRQNQEPILRNSRQYMENNTNAFSPERISVISEQLKTLSGQQAGIHLLYFIGQLQSTIEALSVDNSRYKQAESAIAFNLPQSLPKTQQQQQPFLPRTGFDSQKRKAATLANPPLATEQPGRVISSHSESGGTATPFTLSAQPKSNHNFIASLNPSVVKSLLEAENQVYEEI